MGVELDVECVGTYIGSTQSGRHALFHGRQDTLHDRVGQVRCVRLTRQVRVRQVRWGRHLRAAVFVWAAIAIAAGAIPAAQRADAPTPQTIDELRAAVARVLQEANIPGAGISLVRADGVEWEGGIGLADRDRGTRVTPDTHFRVGSISKTFIAIAIVQMYYDDLLSLHDTIDELAPEIQIDNPWHETDPVRVVNLLQHTAGFDDMHFNELYNLDDPPDMPLLEVLQRNPSSRRVRWRPGTRISYSNPGYALAGYLVEKLSGSPYEDYIDRKILLPLRMNTSSFRLRPEDERLLAQGYGAPTGPPTGFPHIYLRPAGNLHSSPREMGRFVRMLLNWGELDDEFIVDPEYLGNMERSSTTRAAEAGLRTTFGSGLFWDLSLPFPMIGHGGGIEGFTSTYGYSPSRDVGFVILLNSSAPAARRALHDISSLAIRYLKRDVEAPVKPETQLDTAVLDRYVGYYQDANPRNQFIWPLQRLMSGRRVWRDGDQLFMQPLIGPSLRLIPVSETLFRRESDLDATMVFATNGEGATVLTGAQLYAERVPRWRVERVRLPVVLSLLVLMSPLLVAIVWVARLRRSGWWDLKAALLACPIIIAAGVLPLTLTPVREWGFKNAATMMVFIATLSLPALAIVIVLLTVGARRREASGGLVAYALAVALAAAGLSVYLGANGLIGLRLWSY
jgi:CubicO group peptidase (beta-lactamase class C family)